MKKILTIGAIATMIIAGVIFANPVTICELKADYYWPTYDLWKCLIESGAREYFWQS